MIQELRKLQQWTTHRPLRFVPSCANPRAQNSWIGHLTLHNTGTALCDNPSLVCLGSGPLVDEQDGAGWVSIQNNAILENPESILNKH